MADTSSSAKLLELMFPQKPKEPTFAERMLSGQMAPQAEMRAYEPTMRERMATGLQRGLESIGTDRYKARQRAETVMGGPGSNLPLQLGIADIVPFLGTTLQTQEAGRALESAAEQAKRGEYLGAAVEGGLGALGLVPGALGVARYARPVGEATIRAAEAAPKVVAAAPRVAADMVGDLLMPKGTPMERQRGAIKMKGGNWLAGEVETAVDPLKPRGPKESDREWILQHAENQRELGQDPSRILAGLEAIPKNEALDRWIDKKLGGYIRNEMGTPEDPVRKLADQGITHYQGLRELLRPSSFGEDKRIAEGFPAKGFATTELGKNWEALTDSMIMPTRAADYEGSSIVNRNPWLAKVPGDTPIYETGSTFETRDLGFDHLIDVLKEDLATGRIRPEQLEKMSMEQAVRRAHQYDQEMAEKAAKATAAAREGLPVYKEYPQGYRWIELNKPGAFAAESDSMGHSVRGYEPPKGHPDWTEGSGEAGSLSYGLGGWEAIKHGDAKVYSLVDSKGSPHVTVEIGRGKHPIGYSFKGASDEFPETFDYNLTYDPEFPMPTREQRQAILTRAAELYKSSETMDRMQAFQNAANEIIGELPAKINQIKGKQNRAPKEEYLPFVQDFVRSGNWSDVRDFQNTGFISTQNAGNLPSALFKDGRLDPKFYDINPKKVKERLGDQKYVTEQEWMDAAKDLYPNLFKEGKAKGGSVRISDNPDTMRLESDQHYNKGGAVKKVHISNNPDTMRLAVSMQEGGSPRQRAAKTIAGGLRSLIKPAEKPSVLESLPRAQKPEPEAVQLTGALRPAEAPVRGQTSRELLRAQKRELTDDQKELLERLKQSNPEFASAVKFMTPQEVGKIISNPAGVRQLETLLQVLPSAKELASVAKAGTPKQGWYRASTQAIMDVFGVEDAPRFASLLAALSPQTSVEMNLLNTLNVWKNWTAAGRPTDPRDIKRIMGASVAGTKGEESVLEAWTNNAMRSLSAPDPTKVTLSGPKVDSFYRNLADDVYRVTNDAWMASGLGVGQDLFSGSPTALQIARGDPGLSPGYIGTSARMREAGQMANILPSEAQETTWSLFMPLYETARSMGISPREVLQRGLLTPELIRGTPDFATLLTQGKYGDILRGAGYEEQLSRLRPTEFSRGAPDLSLSEQRDLERAAKRLEDLRELRGMESRARMISLPSGASYPENAFAYGTYEAIPGRGLGHLEGLIDEPMGTRQYFSSRVSGAFRDPQGRDVLQGALGLNPIATRGMTGAYRPETEIPFQGTLREPTTGRAPLEINPGFATGVEVPVTRSGDIPERIKRELTAAEAARGYMTAQRGSPWNAQIPSERGESLFVPLEKKADPELMGLTTALKGSQLDLADTGAGTAVLNWGKPLSVEEQSQLIDYLGGQRGVTTKNVSDYVDLSKAFEAGEGSGEATRQLLGIMSRLPENKRSALSEAMRRPAGELADIYEKAAQTRKESVRQDLIRGLRIIQKAGIPGLAAALAAGEALAEEQPTGALPAGR